MKNEDKESIPKKANQDAGDKEWPHIKGWEGGGREDGGEEKLESLAKSGLCTKCYSFINPQECKKDLHVHNALKSHRRKKEMNSTPWLSSCL